MLNFVVKDFKENDSGLEYIGSKKQQLGDGGFIAQFKDGNTGKLLAASNASWRCVVLHRGPLEESCAQERAPVAGQGPCAFTSLAEPAGWKLASYLTDDWGQAVEFTAGEVRPKDGYDRIQWHEDAKLIWSDDLKKDNTLLLKCVIQPPER